MSSEEYERNSCYEVQNVDQKKNKVINYKYG